MRAQCDECGHLYKNKRTMKEHQRQFGHKQCNIEGNIAKLSDVAKVQTELSQKSKLIAKLDDSLKVKDEVIATLHDELDRVTKPEYQEGLIREHLREHLHTMSRESYDKLGESLGYIQETATVEDSTHPPEAEPAVTAEVKNEPETPGQKWWRELNEVVNKERGR